MIIWETYYLRRAAVILCWNKTDFGTDDFDVYVICVSTHKPDDIFSPQIDGILSIPDFAARYI